MDLDSMVGWGLDFVSGNPRYAALLITALLVMRVMAAGLSLADNLFPGKVDSRVGGFVLRVLRILNRYGTAQGAARTTAAAIRPGSMTAARDDDGSMGRLLPGSDKPGSDGGSYNLGEK
jgi:hypothetical protein